MGMTIDDAIKYYSNKNVVLTEEEALANTVAINTMRKYQQLQADYENRLKADMVAMLKEIQVEIEEEAFDMVGLAYIPNTDSANVILMDDLNKIIHQKINSLKED